MSEENTTAVVETVPQEGIPAPAPPPMDTLNTTAAPANQVQQGADLVAGERGKMDDKGELIRTAFCSGFPHDVMPREVHNLFRFSEGFESALVSYKGRVPIAFATFKTQEQALAAMLKYQGVCFDTESHIELRLQLAKSNTTSDQTLSVIDSAGGYGTGSRKRTRYEQPAAAAGYGGVPAYSAAPQRRAEKAPLGPAPPAGVITTLFVANIGMNATEFDLESVFSQLPGYRRMRFSATPGRPPIAFVEFSDVASCTSAQQSMQGHLMAGGAPDGLRVEIAQKQMGTRREGGAPSRYAAPARATYDPYAAPQAQYGADAYGTQYAQHAAYAGAQQYGQW